jgi:hypothetical protein
MLPFIGPPIEATFRIRPPGSDAISAPEDRKKTLTTDDLLLSYLLNIECTH